MKAVASIILAMLATAFSPASSFGEDEPPASPFAMLSHPCMQMSMKLYALLFTGIGQPLMHGALTEMEEAPLAFGGPPMPTFPGSVEDYPEKVRQLADSISEWEALFPADPELSGAFDVIAEHYEQAATAPDFAGVEQAMTTPENQAAWEKILTSVQHYMEEHCDEDTFQQLNEMPK